MGDSRLNGEFCHLTITLTPPVSSLLTDITTYPRAHKPTHGQHHHSCLNFPLDTDPGFLCRGIARLEHGMASKKFGKISETYNGLGRTEMLQSKGK